MDEKLEPGKGGYPHDNLPGRSPADACRMDALWFPQALASDLADEVSGAAGKRPHIDFAGFSSGEEEQSLAPLADALNAGLEGIEVGEEIGPAIFRRRKEA
jgi:hypothetical protein